MKLYDIQTIESANQYLKEKFLLSINEKFARPPRDLDDAHRDASVYGDSNEIICSQYQRQLRNDWSIRFQNEYFQVKKTDASKTIQPKDLITIKKYLDVTYGFWFQGKKLKATPLSRKPEPVSKTKKYYQAKGSEDPVKRRQIARKNKKKSPWSQFNPNWLGSKSRQTDNNKSTSYSG